MNKKKNKKLLQVIVENRDLIDRSDKPFHVRLGYSPIIEEKLAAYDMGYLVVTKPFDDTSFEIEVHRLELIDFS